MLKALKVINIIKRSKAINNSRKIDRVHEVQ